MSGHTFNVSCKEGEREMMRDAVRAVQEELAAVRKRDHVPDSERSALMAALRIAFEARKAQDGMLPGARVEDGLRKVCDRIDQALARENRAKIPAEAGNQ